MIALISLTKEVDKAQHLLFIKKRKVLANQE